MSLFRKYVMVIEQKLNCFDPLLPWASIDIIDMTMNGGNFLHPNWKCDKTDTSSPVLHKNEERSTCHVSPVAVFMLVGVWIWTPLPLPGCKLLSGNVSSLKLNSSWHSSSLKFKCRGRLYPTPRRVDALAYQSAVPKAMFWRSMRNLPTIRSGTCTVSGASHIPVWTVYPLCRWESRVNSKMMMSSASVHTPVCKVISLF